MSYTSPSTFIAGSVLTAAQGNIHWRDNMIAVRAGGLAMSGQGGEQVVITDSATLLKVLALTALQSIRKNAGNTAIEAYTPMAGSGAASRVAYWTSASDVSSDADFTFDGTDVIANLLGLTTALKVATKLALSATAPTIGSGFGTSPSISANNGTGAFRVNVGTGGVATSGVITMPEAATGGWNAMVSVLDPSGGSAPWAAVTASSTTSITITGFSSTGASAAWASGGILLVQAWAY